MKKRSRRYQEVKNQIPLNKHFSAQEGLDFLCSHNQEKSKNIKVSFALDWTNKKNSNLTKTISSEIAKFKKEKKPLKVDKSGNIHTLVGKSDFGLEQLTTNYQNIYNKVANLRPNGWKGQFLNLIALSTTMGPSLRVSFKL